MSLTRYKMYKRISECLKEPIRGKILGISSITNFYPLIDKERSEIIVTEYPEIDMQNLPFAENSFNYVISDQVIEHLENPQKAIDESYRVLKEDGMVIHTTCFMNYIHVAPKDFYRFSPDALKYLCRNFSEVMQCEGWGNRVAILICFMGERFRSINIPASRFSIKNIIANYNEEHYPIVTWIVAKK
ncbi:MAG: class I SAM-dependent methyltransferase [bacterium]